MQRYSKWMTEVLCVAQTLVMVMYEQSYIQMPWARMSVPHWSRIMTKLSENLTLKYLIAILNLNTQQHVNIMGWNYRRWQMIMGCLIGVAFRYVYSIYVHERAKRQLHGTLCTAKLYNRMNLPHKIDMNFLNACIWISDTQNGFSIYNTIIKVSSVDSIS